MHILGHTFFGHNLAIFRPIGLIFLWQLRNLVSIDWLWVIKVMRLILIFGPLLAAKWVWPSRGPLMAWGLKTQQKSWPTGWTFWANCYLENVFSKFSCLNPLPLKDKSYLDPVKVWSPRLTKPNIRQTVPIANTGFIFLYLNPSVHFPYDNWNSKVLNRK